MNGCSKSHLKLSQFSQKQPSQAGSSCSNTSSIAHIFSRFGFVHPIIHKLSCVSSLARTYLIRVPCTVCCINTLQWHGKVYTTKSSFWERTTYMSQRYKYSASTY